MSSHDAFPGFHIFPPNLSQLTMLPIRLGELNVRQCRSAEQLINGEILINKSETHGMGNVTVYMGPGEPVHGSYFPRYHTRPHLVD